MLTVASTTDVVPRLVQDDEAALRTTMISVLHTMKAEMMMKLQVRLTGWLPSEAARQARPFLTDPADFLSKYEACFGVVESDGVISVVVDHAKLAEYGFPDNLVDILEYGDLITPPFPHIGPVVRAISEYISRGMPRFKR